MGTLNPPTELRTHIKSVVGQIITIRGYCPVQILEPNRHMTSHFLIDRQTPNIKGVRIVSSGSGPASDRRCQHHVHPATSCRSRTHRIEPMSITPTKTNKAKRPVRVISLSRPGRPTAGADSPEREAGLGKVITCPIRTSLWIVTGETARDTGRDWLTGSSKSPPRVVVRADLSVEAPSQEDTNSGKEHDGVCWLKFELSARKE